MKVRSPALEGYKLTNFDRHLPFRTAQVQKLLFSATLTRDPAKIAALELRNPRYISVQEVRADGRADIRAEDEFTLPASLQVRHFVHALTSCKR